MGCSRCEVDCTVLLCTMCPLIHVRVEECAALILMCGCTWWVCIPAFFPQLNPHLVLVDTKLYAKRLLPLLAQWLAVWMQHQLQQPDVMLQPKPLLSAREEEHYREARSLVHPRAAASSTLHRKNVAANMYSPANALTRDSSMYWCSGDKPGVYHCVLFEILGCPWLDWPCMFSPCCFSCSHIVWCSCATCRPDGCDPGCAEWWTSLASDPGASISVGAVAVHFRPKSSFPYMQSQSTVPSDVVVMLSNDGGATYSEVARGRYELVCCAVNTLFLRMG